MDLLTMLATLANIEPNQYVEIMVKTADTVGTRPRVYPPPGVEYMVNHYDLTYHEKRRFVGHCCHSDDVVGWVTKTFKGAETPDAGVSVLVKVTTMQGFAYDSPPCARCYSTHPIQLRFNTEAPIL